MRKLFILVFICLFQIASSQVQQVPTTDTPNQGRLKWNANDVLLQSRIDSSRTVPVTLIKPNHVTEYYYTIQGAIDAAVDSSIIHIGIGKYSSSASSGAQYTMTNKDNVQIIIDGTLSVGNGAPANLPYLRFIDCDNLTISGLGGIDGNIVNQGWGYGADLTKAAIYVIRNSQNRSTSKLRIDGITIKHWPADAIVVNEGDNIEVEHCRIDSVGEGIVTENCTNVSVIYNSIGRIFDQDGIEPASSSNVLVGWNTFTDSPGPGNVCLEIFRVRDGLIVGNKTFGIIRPLSMNYLNRVTLAYNEIGRTGDWGLNLNATDTSVIFEHNIIKTDTAGLFGGVFTIDNQGEARTLNNIIRFNEFYVSVGLPAIYVIGHSCGLQITDNFIRSYQDRGVGGIGIAFSDFPSPVFKANGVVCNRNTFDSLNIGIYFYNSVDSMSFIGNRWGKGIAHPLWPTTSEDSIGSNSTCYDNDGKTKDRLIGGMVAPSYKVSSLNVPFTSSTATSTKGDIRFTASGIDIAVGNNTNKRVKSAPPFDILDIPGTQLWLRPAGATDAGMVNNPVDGGTVVYWIDASGSWNPARTASSVGTPSFQENEINGNSIVRFNGSTDYMQFIITGAFAGSEINDANFTVHIAAQNIVGDDNHFLYGPTQFCNLGVSADALVMYINDGTNVITGTIITPLEPHVYTYYKSGTIGRLYQDNTLVGSGTLIAGTVKMSRIGQATLYPQGDIEEIVIDSVAQSDLNRIIKAAILEERLGHTTLINSKVEVNGSISTINEVKVGDTLRVGMVPSSSEFTQGTRAGGTNFPHAELRPQAWMEKGLGIFPSNDGVGYSSLNLYVGYNPRGMGLLNIFEQNPSGKYVAHWAMGTDVVQARVGVDSLSPVFIPWAVYGINNAVQDLASIVGEDFTQTGVGNHYRGEMGFGLAPPLVGSAISVASPSSYPDANSVFSIFRSTEGGTNSYLTLRHGTSGLTKLEIFSNAAIRFYKDDGSISPFNGAGWDLTYNDANQNIPWLKSGQFIFETGTGAVSGGLVRIQDGTVTLDEKASAPSDPANGIQTRCYMKGDKFIISYNDGGTIKFRYLTLTSTDATWTYTTTPP